MIKVFYGDDRVRAMREVERLLGAEMETIDCEKLTALDLGDIFYGTTLFAAERKILLRDFFVNKEICEKLPEYLDTKHTIVLLEMKLDKRTVIYKELAKEKEKIEFVEFALPKPKLGQVFDIYGVAKRDGVRAVKMLKEIEAEQDPYMFLGLLSSSAIKDFAVHPGAKEKRVLAELSKIDMQMKTATIQSWLLIESFLLGLSSWQ